MQRKKYMVWRMLFMALLLLVSGCSIPKEESIATLHIREQINRINDVDDMSMAAFNAGGKWGYLNVNNGVVIEPLYDQVSPYYLGYTVLVKDGKSQLANRQGQLVLDEWVEAHIEYNAITEAYTYYDKSKSKHIFVDVDELEPADAPEENLYGKWNLGRYTYHIVDNKGNLYDKERRQLVFDQYYLLLRDVYSEAREQEIAHYFIMESEEGLGFSEVFNGEARTIVYGPYDSGRLFADSKSIIMGKGQEKYLFDFKGNVLFGADGFKTQISHLVSDGRIAMKEEGKWGYIDASTGNRVIKPVYSEASDFHKGYAVVKFENKTMGIINKHGDLVVKTN